MTFLEAWRLRERLLPEGDRDIEELARLLPPPTQPDLAPDRHRQLRQHFLQEITESRVASRAAADRWRSRRLLVLAAAVVAVGLAAGGTTLALRTAPGDRLAPVVVVQQGDSSAVGELLDHIALVAAMQPAITVDTAQFLYIKSKVSFMAIKGPGKIWLEPVHIRQIWLPQDPKHAGLLQENGRTRTLDPGGQTNEQLVGTLPTDPTKLLAKAYAETKGQGNGPDQEAFVYIDDHLFESLPSPETSAALYRAAALIPGVVKIDDSVDAIGRQGVAVGRTDEATGIRTEWIFDRSTYAYLGQRSYMVHDNYGIKAGTVTGISAVLERAVVDRAGQTP
ncbi:CU044_5270 family protein [Dactylosporangium sp. NPDC051485]|uniref:CU044_5270 family protein n=1 Tax=Dactylosporangium sp. NPDC051485 TaxID=3154846 RepID=UPI00341FAF05